MPRLPSSPERLRQPAILSYYPSRVLRAVLLDLDDTLYDRSVAFAAWARDTAVRQLGRELDAADFATLVRFDERGHRRRVELAEDARALGLTIDAPRFALDLAEYVRPEADVQDTLTALARSHRVAIVTNGGPAQRIKLAKLGLANIPHAVFVSEEVGFAKPDRRIFDRALQWAECTAREALFVGDHPTADIAPARALGMQTAWRVRGEWPGQPPPTYRITKIGQLLELVA